MKIDKILEKQFEELGDNHASSSAETPLRNDAFEISDDEKIERIEQGCISHSGNIGNGPHRR